MNDQRQHETQQEILRSGSEGTDAANSEERLAAARDHLEQIFAAADSILEDIGQANNERFLEQVRQSGGE